ncbi:MAG TPA: universal stress protein [Herpetosiphonaceae bacterium]
MTRHNALIPLDGSAFSREILSPICRLFDPGEYHVTLLRVAEPPESLVAAPPRPLPVDHMLLTTYDSAREAELAHHPIYDNQRDESLRAGLEAELQPDVQRLRAAGFQVSVMIRFGDPAEEIIDVTEQHKMDVVAMATHGRTGLRRLVLGSVAEQVVSKLTIPVLLISPFARPITTQVTRETAVVSIPK